MITSLNKLITMIIIWSDFSNGTAIGNETLLPPQQSMDRQKFSTGQFHPIIIIIIIIIMQFV